MFEPNQLAGSKPSMFYCGNDASAKNMIEKILKEFGWEDTLDLGGIECARDLEALTLLWIKISGKRNSYNHAFKDLR
jgi:predicted dinucleotide-binding enzyme